ncbi:MAG TPA: alanyl-tRNA editing protein [Candidatus Sulfomarinibacteraceae bacterium]|nr:alanyl-tRNA editing protein [Candidatus Sulfomarinibacteraceae bacterium]
MTERLYYKDAYTRTFDAAVVERFRHEHRTALILDRTYFYPTSGGQPSDRGSINGAPVRDVFIREEDGAIVHLMGGEVWSDAVQCEINWDRRFDHMQQHTGQHILSQAFIQSADARTVGFHLSDNSVTIDLAREQLRPEEIEQAELLANQIVWEDRPVRIRMISASDAEELALRKIPELDGDTLRLVEIEKFDRTACGGTHVSRTGAVGIIKIVKVERRRNQLRVEFCCGRRALFDYRHKNRVVKRLSAEFTTSSDELENAVANLRDELKQARRQARRLQAETMDLLAEKFLAAAPENQGVRVVTRVFDERSADDVRSLAQQIASRSGAVALFGLSGESSQLIFARADDAPGQMNELLKPALQVLGNAAGGGSGTYAQGGGPAANHDRVRQALSRAERLLLAQIH